MGDWLGDKASNAANKPTQKLQGVILPPLSTDHDKVFVYDKEDQDAYDQCKQDASDEISTLKKGLRIFLRSRKMTATERGLEEGALDELSVWKIRAGETSRLYKRKRSADAINTAACMMVDLSSSMNEGLTRLAAVMAVEALASFPKVQMKIAGFTTGYVDSFTVKTQKGYGRAAPLHIPLFKDFDDSGKKMRARVGGLSTTMYTPLGEAYFFGLESLLERKEPNRILWIITDGSPEFPLADSSHSDYALMRDVYAKCKRFKIKVVCIALGSVRVKMAEFADVVMPAKDASQLPVAVLEMVKNLVEVRSW
jgi:nitric oxide reductase activation protein